MKVGYFWYRSKIVKDLQIVLLYENIINIQVTIHADVMSVLTLQVGQCGNQVGKEFFETITQDCKSKVALRKVPVEQNEAYCQDLLRCFFEEQPGGRWRARAVLTDMESKVVSHCLKEASRSNMWCYDSKSTYCQKRGSGNNWAQGFCFYGPKTADDILEKVQAQMEKCDRVEGIVNLMSVAGGTGSGVGTYLTQALRDHYPHVFILNQLVWPYSSGEVTVQNYNAMLTLAHLYHSADGVMLLENDHLHKICGQVLGVQQISTESLNRIIGQQLLSILAPAGTQGTQASLGLLLDHTVSHPGYKLLTVRHTPHIPLASQDFTVHTWPGLLKCLRQMAITNSASEAGMDWTTNLPAASNSSHGFPRSLSSLLVLRGTEAFKADISALSDSRLYSSWIPLPCPLQTWTNTRPLLNSDMSATLLSNSQAILGALESVETKAWNMFSARAYLHQYAQHGIGDEQMTDGFTMLAQVVKSYKNLSLDTTS